MWPFASKAKKKTMNLKWINDDYAVTSQLSLEAVKEAAEAGFKGIICTRPDGEDFNQPSYAAVAAEAKRLGLVAGHVPFAGQPSLEAANKFAAILDAMPTPVLGYCRSGNRAAVVHAMVKKA